MQRMQHIFNKQHQEEKLVLKAHIKRESKLEIIKRAEKNR